MNTIKDFGEKIGGAKKDLWKERNFTLEDIESLTEREAFKYCVKSNIWSKPNYEALCQEKPTVVVYFIKKLRDSLPAKVKPLNNENENKKNLKNFVEFISLVRDIIMNINSEIELIDLFDKIFINNGYYNRNWTNKVYENKSIQNKFIRASQINSRLIEKAKEEIKKTGFPKKNKDAWKKNIKIIEKEHKFFIIKKKSYYYEYLCESPFNTRELAEKYLDNELKEKLKKRKMNILTKPQLKKITRVGFCYRHQNATTDMMLETFNFRGGEFGNWANDTERQMHLNYAFDALLDLAYLLNVDPQFISLNGRLGIAFGARGSGKALAHYEPAKMVINLTKVKGAGSLAHEWFHSFDDYLGTLSGANNIRPFASESRVLFKKEDSILSEDLISNFKNIIEVMKKRECSLEEKEETLKRKLKMYKSYLKNCLDPIEKYLAKELKEFKKISERMYKYENTNASEIEKIIEELNILHKKVKGIKLDKKSRESLYSSLFWIGNYSSKLKNGNINVNQKKDTAFYITAKKLDKTRSKPYWSTNVELIARAFEAFAQDKFKESNYQSDYLVHHADNNAFPGLNIYPEGKERTVINNAFDSFFKILKEELKFKKFEYNVIDSINSINDNTDNSKISININIDINDYKKCEQISFL